MRGGGGGRGGFVRAEFLCVSVLGVSSRPGVGLAGCGGALSPRWFALLAVLGRWSRCWSYSLLLCGLFCEAIYFMSCLVLFCSCVVFFCCCFLFVCFFFVFFFVFFFFLLFFFFFFFLFLFFFVLLALRLPRLGEWGVGGGGWDWSWCFSYVCSICVCSDLPISSSC